MSKIILYFVLISGMATVVILDEKEPLQDIQKVKQGTENNTGTHSSHQFDMGRDSEDLPDGSTEQTVTHIDDKSHSDETLISDIHLEVDEPWFEVTDTLSIDKIKPLSVSEENISAIEFRNIIEFSNLSSGDSVQLLLPNGENISISVTKSQQQLNNTKTWSGIFKSNGSDYPVAFTFGEKNTFGVIEHPDVEYKITGLKSTAWLYEVPQKLSYESSP
ncbi:hypothetical protein HC752_04210 [Vibrio sp. S9_S30]|uniref:hypothetical protein n=1 Tax=Vibrio sp. S9_S30 TaxID=2720226 RepID=UPI0016809841|nr:hypothetical protein [Vibrio sp. S9_S30]MBD1556131.1 hypothetical protein [Vibrio sp. S9_S30]